MRQNKKIIYIFIIFKNILEDKIKYDIILYYIIYLGHGSSSHFSSKGL